MNPDYELQPVPIPAAERSRGTAALHEGSGDELVQRVLPDGLELWTSARAARRDPSSVRGVTDVAERLFELPQPKDLADRFGGWTGEALVHFVPLIERSFMPDPGLCIVHADGSVERTTRAPTGRKPALMLLHGTFSNPVGAFADLLEASDWAALHTRYSGRVYALRHHTVATSPMSNVSDLLDALGGATPTLDLISHSRGGLVGDLLCIGDRLQLAPVQRAYGATWHGAEDDWRRMLEARPWPAVRRFVRVAAPAEGTPLIGTGTRLHRGLSVLKWLVEKGAKVLEGAGAPPVLDEIVAFAGSVILATIASTEDPSLLAGLASMDPDGGLATVLKRAPRDTTTRLFDVQGRYGRSWLNVVRWVSDFLHSGRNDLVVPTRSMGRGVRRTLRRSHVEDDVWHIRYFARPPIRKALARHLRGEVATRSLGAATEEAGPRGTVLLVPAALGTRWVDAQGWETRSDAPGAVEDGLVSAYDPLLDALEQAGWVVEVLPYHPGETPEQVAGRAGPAAAVVAHLEGAAVAEVLGLPVVVLGRCVPRPDPRATMDRVFEGSGAPQTYEIAILHAGQRWPVEASAGSIAEHPGALATVLALLDHIHVDGPLPSVGTGAPDVVEIGSPDGIPDGSEEGWDAAYGTEVEVDTSLRVRVLWGRYGEAAHPLVAFRYAGEPLSGALAELDRTRPELGLDRSLRARLLPDTVAGVWCSHDLMIVGLDVAGVLDANRVELAVARAVSKALLDGRSDLSFAVPGLTGADELGVWAATEAIVQGALRAERDLLRHGVPCDGISEIQLVEPRRDLAAELVRGVRRLAGTATLDRAVVAPRDVERAAGFQGGAPHPGDLGRYSLLRVEGASGDEGDDEHLPERVYVAEGAQAPWYAIGRVKPFAHLRPASSADQVDIATRLMLPAQALSVLDGPVLVESHRAFTELPWERLTARDRLPVALRYGMLRRVTVEGGRHLRQPNAGRDALVIGNPQGAGLPGAAAEAEAVAGVLREFGYEVITSIDATGDENLAALLDRPWRIVHIASHGNRAGELLLGEDSRGDPVALGPGDLDHVQGSGIPALVFLNCCWSGAGIDVRGFAKALFTAGVRAFVGAGWAVDDTAAADFGRTFYEELLAGERLATATVSARRAAATWSDPNASWAAYQVYGEPSFRADLGGARVRIDVDRLVGDYEAIDAVMTLAGLIKAGQPGPARSILPKLWSRYRDSRNAELRYRLAFSWADAFYAEQGTRALEQAREILGDPSGDRNARLKAILFDLELAWSLGDEDAPRRILELSKYLGSQTLHHMSALAALAGGDIEAARAHVAKAGRNASIEAWLIELLTAEADGVEPPDLATRPEDFALREKAAQLGFAAQPEQAAPGVVQMRGNMLSELVSKVDKGKRVNRAVEQYHQAYAAE